MILPWRNVKLIDNVSRTYATHQAHSDRKERNGHPRMHRV